MTVGPPHPRESTSRPRGSRATEVRFYDFATHATQVVRTLEKPPDALGGLGIAVSADQRWLLYTRSDRSESDIMMLRPESSR